MAAEENAACKVDKIIFYDYDAINNFAIFLHDPFCHGAFREFQMKL